MNQVECALHPGVRALYRCDGCGRALCSECIQTSHALLLCKACGERALPLDQDRAATVREKVREEAIAKPYALSEAFAYPFRGLGKFLFAATLLSMAVVEFGLTFGFGCYRYFLAFGFYALLVALQFKIVDTTAEGETELPDWPEYFNLGDRIADILTYLFVLFLQWAPLAAAIYLLGPERLVTDDPSLTYWLLIAFFAWVGIATWLVAFGAAGKYGRGSAMRVDLHARAFFAAGRDAIVITNVVFAIGVAFFVVRALLSVVPILGAAIAAAVGAYWSFVSAHLAGLLVRRNARRLAAIYD